MRMPLFNAIENIAKNLLKPSTGFYGAFVQKSLSANKSLEKNAVRLLKIESHHKVLEVGFGPGHGINYVFDGGFYGGSGKMYAVDFSAPMCEHVRRRFTDYIEAEKLVVLNEDVAKMSLPDCYFDKVFHTNSHLYWPDLHAACTELYRVMNTGSDMVTVMNLFRIKNATKRSGVLKYAKNLSPNDYMDALKSSGFVSIGMKKIKRPFLPPLHAILCRKD